MVARPSRSGREQLQRSQAHCYTPPPTYVWPADGGRNARTMMDRSCPPWERRRPRRLTLQVSGRRGRRRSQGGRASGLASNPHQHGAAITTQIPPTIHSPQSSTSPHLQAQRPQAYCYTPPTVALHLAARPRVPRIPWERRRPRRLTLRGTASRAAARGPEAPREVRGSQPARACCCTGPGAPVRGRRSAVSGV